MLLDSQNLFCSSQALTSVGSVNSTNVIDLGVNRDIFRGNKDLQFWVRANVAFTSGGSATLQVAFVTADNAALTTNPTVLEESDAVPVAKLIAGFDILSGGVPRSRGPFPQRYLGVIFTVGTAAMTAGSVSAGFALDLQSAFSYPSGINVSGF